MKPYIIENKELMKEWDWEKNNVEGLNPEKITEGSKQNVWWGCRNCNYKWQAAPNNRIRGTGCPECGKKKCIKSRKENRKERNEGFASICKKNDEIDLLNSWHPTKNDNINPNEISYYSDKNVWWKCQVCGGEWQSTINSRTKLLKNCVNKCGCPYCSGHKVLLGYNDLKTFSHNEGLDYIIDEWNDVKDITKFTKGSDYKALWKCRFCGHEWNTSIRNRVNLSAGRTSCPKCNNQTSFAEQAVFYYVKKYFPEATNRYIDLGFELDVFIPSIKTAIEYDGFKYHKYKERMEKQKNQQCAENGIILIRIREEGLCRYDACVCFFRKKSKNIADLNAVLKETFNYLGIINSDIDVARDYSEILESYKTLCLESSLAVKFPEIAVQWHPTKNNNLKPENMNYGSNHIAWWQCEKGHEWQAIIYSRTGPRKSSCPYCSNKKVLKNYNDFETYCKNNNLEYLLKEWDYEKNNVLDIMPNNIIYSSNKRVFWKCNEGHEWRINISKRIGDKGTGCPTCAIKQRMVTRNNNKIKEQGTLEQNNPELLLEWDYSKNKNINSNDVICGTPIRVWWKCSVCGYEWMASVLKRTREKTGCPCCAGRVPMIGVNDLRTKYPEIAAQWHPTKNGNLKPDEILPRSGKEVWWLCPDCGYEWIVNSRDRVNGRGCPCCSGTVLVSGKNDLQTVHPDIAAQWHLTKNGNMAPNMVSAGSGKKMWWQCEHSHEWQATINNRKRGNGCPYCANRKLLVGYNDLETWCKNNSCFNLLKEYDYKKNELLPNEILYCSHKEIWFKCKTCKYEWRTKLTNRTGKNKRTGCPYCGNAISKK